MKFNVDDLFALDDITFSVELAYDHAESMTKSNEIIYETDFKAGKVKDIHTNYYYNPYVSLIEYPLEEKLAEVKRL